MASDDDQASWKLDGEALAEVVRLHPERDLGDEDAPVATKPRDPKARYCAHKRIALDHELHRVICRDCDKEVDPFKFLAMLAGEWERHATFRKETRRRAEEARVRLVELLRLEDNARSRLKRIDPKAEKSAPKRPWGHSKPPDGY